MGNMDGFLAVKGADPENVKWEERLWKLDDAALKCFNREEPHIFMGSFPLDDFSNVQFEERKNECNFEINGKIVRIRARTKDEARSWYEGIVDAIQALVGELEEEMFEEEEEEELFIPAASQVPASQIAQQTASTGYIAQQTASTGYIASNAANRVASAAQTAPPRPQPAAVAAAPTGPTSAASVPARPAAPAAPTAARPAAPPNSAPTGAVRPAAPQRCPPRRCSRLPKVRRTHSRPPKVHCLPQRRRLQLVIGRRLAKASLARMMVTARTLLLALSRKPRSAPSE